MLPAISPPAQQIYPTAGPVMSGYPTLQPPFPGALPQNFAAQPFPAQGTGHESLHPGGADPNSPELFRRNMQLVQEHVLRLREIAKRALDGIQNAYRVGRTPTQTDADLAALTQTLHLVSELMRHTGVGGLPLLPPAGAPPTEDALLAQTGHAVHATYDRLVRAQESAAVVANILGHHAQSQPHPPGHR
ncbi:hypothetical protein GGX14DRAFT_601520 [Mycena pura]|uniref:Uncharacterized protein n=1 Tax=Mycena pura TaxID=153505 RepID=A0AAD6Y4C2_9AGAR|nr:hypothetical protein GGX14DRAFT_601520 [Mycena pura]